MDRGLYGVRIGDKHLYGSRHATAEETRSITVRNVRSRGKYALSSAGAMSGLTYESIDSFDGAQVLKDEREN